MRKSEGGWRQYITDLPFFCPLFLSFGLSPFLSTLHLTIDRISTSDFAIVAATVNTDFDFFLSMEYIYGVITAVTIIS